MLSYTKSRNAGKILLQTLFFLLLITQICFAQWYQQSSGTTETLHGVSFTDTNNGTTVGEEGTILHTTNGGVIFVEEEQIDEVPTGFLLSQNYPNPLNPSTRIRYSVPQFSNVVIKVFNILGNEIETLVNEEKNIGIY